MKKTIFLTTLALALTVGTASAQMGGGSGMMKETGRQQQTMMQPGMMGGYGMGPGMMGGCGMSPGMMGGGYGMGPGMMGGGYGMGPGMMGGYGMGQGTPGPADPEKYQKFLDETKESRKKLHDLRFEYSELMRNPKGTMKDKMQMEKKMFELQQELQEKAGE